MNKYLFINAKGQVGLDNDDLPVTVPSGVVIINELVIKKNMVNYHYVLKFTGVLKLKYVHLKSPVGVLIINNNYNNNSESI